jgi:hypothetical protein
MHPNPEIAAMVERWNRDRRLCLMVSNAVIAAIGLALIALVVQGFVK